VRFGFVAVGTLDQRARLIRHDQARHAADELEREHLGADPVGGGLARGRARERVVRRAERGHEDLCGGDLAGKGVDDGHRRAGIVDEQLLAGEVDLAHRAQLALRELAVLDAEAGVLVGQRVVAGVLLPQQHQRDVGALELLVDDGEVRRELVARARHRWAIQPGLQGLVVQSLRDVPVDARHAGQQHVLADDALGNLEREAHLVVAQTGLQVKAQCLSNTAHRDSVRGHRLHPKYGEPMPGSVDHLRAPPVVHDLAETASTIRLKRRPRSR